MRSLFSLLLMGVSFLSPAQNNPSPEDLIKCRGLPQVQLKAKFFIKGVEQKEYIRKSDLQNDGYLFLSDTTYKILGFWTSYDCHSGLLTYDIHTKVFLGNRVIANSNYMKAIRRGDTFVIECINVQKNGKVYEASAVFEFLIE